MREGGLDDGLRRIAGRVADRNPPRRRGVEVDVVDARGGFADQPQARGARDQFRVHADLVDDQHVAVPYARERLFARGHRIGDQFAEGGDFVQRSLPQRGRIQKYDFHTIKIHLFCHFFKISLAI